MPLGILYLIFTIINRAKQRFKPAKVTPERYSIFNVYHFVVPLVELAILVSYFSARALYVLIPAAFFSFSIFKLKSFISFFEKYVFSRKNKEKNNLYLLWIFQLEEINDFQECWSRRSGNKSFPSSLSLSPNSRWKLNYFLVRYRKYIYLKKGESRSFNLILISDIIILHVLLFFFHHQSYSIHTFLF